MHGVILCKSSNNINVVAVGEYDLLQSHLEYFCKIAGDNDIKLVNASGMDIFSMIENQCLINETFSKEFNRTS